MSARTPAGDKGTADRIEADDGGYWVRLVTWQALDREGACMRHCVGDGDYDDLVGGEDLVDDAIWSLRDRDGLSVLTVRIRHRELNYAKGYSNHPPGRGAAMQVRHLVAAFKAAGHKLVVFASNTDIVLLEDGRTFRHDRLPPEVQAEREAGQRRREAARPIYNIPYGQVTFRLFDPFALTAGETDPVVRIWATFDTGCHTYVTRSGIRFNVPYDVFGREPRRTQDFLTRYHAAVATAGQAPAAATAAPVDPRIGLITNEIPDVADGDVIDLRDPGAGSVLNISDVAIRDANGQPLAEWVDYRVDAGLGMVMMRAAHDRVTVDFRAGVQPERLVMPWPDVVLTNDTARIDPRPDTPVYGPGGGARRVTGILGEASSFVWSTDLR